MTATTAHAEAAELLRTALLAKLAVDLGDPALAGRAASQARNHARILAGLDFPAWSDDEDDEDDEELPQVEAMLAARYPGAAGSSDDGTPTRVPPSGRSRETASSAPDIPLRLKRTGVIA